MGSGRLTRGECWVGATMHTSELKCTSKGWVLGWVTLVSSGQFSSSRST